MSKNIGSLAQLAEHKIINMIVSGKLELGSRITEANLAELLSISTAPVHQALQALSRLGIVIIKPRKGTYVFNFTIDDIRKMALARYSIESEAVREAYSNNSSRFCLEMSRLISRMEHHLLEGSCEKYLKLDAEFHELFFAYADNEFLKMASNAITIKVTVLWHLTALEYYTLEDMRISFEDHRQILDFLMLDNVDSACGILAIHLKRLEEIYSRDCLKSGQIKPGTTGVGVVH